MNPVQTRGIVSPLLTWADEQSATGVTSEVDIGYLDTIVVEIYGTVTSSTITFLAKVGSGTGRAIEGTRVDSTTTKATQTTGMNQIWRFDVRGIEKLYFNCTAFVGTSFSIIGRGIA